MKFKLLSLLLCAAAICGGGWHLHAQTKTVKGLVTEEDGIPAIGAYVTVENSQNVGTVTDIDGNFILDKVPEDAKFLIVSYMGFLDARVAIAPEVHVILKPDSEVLEGVVVTGMQKMDRRLFTGSASKVDAAEAKLDGMADVSRSLEGRVAGVSVQNVSGTFGTAPKIRVRGATSIYGSSKPLWVVDGVIMQDVVDVSADELSSGDANTLISSAIAGLNSDDIESFDILKDGSATSIYGARAMAGVIVITTKKGKAGTTNVSYTGEFSTRLKPRYSTFNIMNSQDQMNVYQELSQKGYLQYAATANAANSGVYGKMFELLETYDPVTKKFALENTSEARSSYLRQAEMRNTNWFDRLFSTSLQQNHSVSISGGTDRGTYYASVSAMLDPGWSKQSSVERYTANFNTSTKIFDNLTLNVIGNASYRKQRAPGTISSSVDAETGEISRSFDINPYSYSLNTSRTLDPDTFYTSNYARFNIMHELDNNYIDLKVTDFRVQGELVWKPVSHLELNALGSIKYSSTSNEHFILDDSNQALAYRAMGNTTIRNKNRYLYSDPEEPAALPITVLPQGGIYDRANNDMTGYDFRTTANYSNTFGNVHIVNLYGGMELNHIARHSSYFRGWGMQYSMGEVANYVYEMFKKQAEENSMYFNLNNTRELSAAFFANGTYSYKGKYIFNGTARYEGTNKLGRSRSARWLPTWNLSGAWNVHEEGFFRSLDPVLSHLSLKASYSLTADRGPSSVTNSLVVISSSTPWRQFSRIREAMLDIEQVANSELTYEKKHEFNIGVETGFLNNRINFAIDWYKRNNFDLIGIVNTQGVGGQVQKFGNIATMKSSGVELSLSTTNVKTKDFSWSSNFIYSHSHNEVTDLKTTVRVIDLITGSGFAQEGYPVRGLFSIPFAGLSDTGLPTFYNENGEVTTTEIDFQLTDSDKIKYLKYSGNADPSDVGSFGNTFTYKGLRLNVFLTYSFGNVIRLDPVFSNEYDDLDATPKEFNNRWTVAGDENLTNVPVIVSSIQNRETRYLNRAYNAYNYSTERIAKGDFIRLKEVSLSYDLPKDFVKSLSLSALSLKLQATNLCLLYADKKLNGNDPEFFNTGGVAVPLPKQFTLTLRVGF